MRSPLLDEPIQRQMILLKLIDAMSRRPEFGNSYDNDPDGPIQQWFSRVKALTDRVSVSKSVEFRAALSTSVSYWQASVRSLQITANDAIEELRLELELYRDEQIGQIYDASESHRFKVDLLAIVGSASNDVFVVDPYFDAESFSLFFENKGSFPMRALCSNYFSAVSGFARSFSAQHNRAAEIRKSGLLHDRVVFVDDDCWIVGASLKDAGKKPTYLMPLPPLLGAEKRRIYEDIWSKS